MTRSPDEPITIRVNGHAREYPASLTVGALLEDLGMKWDRVAVELNRDILPRDRWAATDLHDGDQLEIVHFVGGGSHFLIPISGF